MVIPIAQPRGNRRYERGQGMSEYIIIVALIAVAAIGVVSYFGDIVGHQMAGMAQELAGQDGGGEVGQAISQAQSITGVAADKTLADYATKND